MLSYIVTKLYNVPAEIRRRRRRRDNILDLAPNREFGLQVVRLPGFFNPGFFFLRGGLILFCLFGGLLLPLRPLLGRRGRRHALLVLVDEIAGLPQDHDGAKDSAVEERDKT